MNSEIEFKNVFTFFNKHSVHKSLIDVELKKEQHLSNPAIKLYCINVQSGNFDIYITNKGINLYGMDDNDNEIDLFYDATGLSDDEYFNAMVQHIELPRYIKIMEIHELLKALNLDIKNHIKYMTSLLGEFS